MSTVLSPFRKVSFGLCLAFSALLAMAQHGDLLKQGQWTVQLPGGCSSLPLLQVNGPGTLFDAKNSGALSDLQHALSAPLAKACPGVHEAVLVNGRGRKLVKIEGALASVPGPLAPAGSVALPVSTAPVDSSPSTQTSPVQAQTKGPTQPPRPLPVSVADTNTSGLPASPFVDMVDFRNQQARHPAVNEHRMEPLKYGALKNENYSPGQFVSIVDRARNQPGVKLLLERLQNGRWIPTTVSFKAQDQSFVTNGDPYLGKIVASRQSEFVVTVSENGVVTGEEAGSADNLRGSGQYYLEAGTMTWTGNETLDLNTGLDHWTFQGQMNGHYSSIPIFNGVKGTLTASDSVHRDLAMVPTIDESLTKGDVNVASDPANPRALIIGNLSFRGDKGASTLRFSDRGVLSVPLVNRAGLDLNEVRYTVTTAEQNAGLLNATTLSGPFKIARDAQMELPLPIGTGFDIPQGAVHLIVTVSYKNTVLGRRSLSVPTEPFYRDSKVHLPDVTATRLRAVAKYFGNGNTTFGDPAPELAASASRDPMAAMWEAAFLSQGAAGYKVDQEKAYRDARRLLPQMEESARNGDAEALYLFFYVCQLGLEGEGAKADSVQFLDRAASAGFLPAKFDQGRLMSVGKNNSNAVGVLTEVYEAGVKAAASVLGRVYEQGLGVERDPQTALKWYQRGADFGDPVALLGLANLTAGGVGQDQPDAIRAMQLARKAAARRYAPAYVYIGRAYESGRQGVKQDQAAASRAFKDAADLGDRDGMLSLGVVLLGYVPGFTSDERAGAYWIRQAAEHESPQAMVLLSNCYREGKGFEKDEIAARYWFNQAALRGVVPGENRAAEVQQEMAQDVLDAMSSAPSYVYVNRYGDKVGESGPDYMGAVIGGAIHAALGFYGQQQRLIDGMEFIKKRNGKKIYGGTVSSAFTSKLQLRAGETISIRVYGIIVTGMMSGNADANGLGQAWPEYRIVPNIPTSAVMGKIGDSPWQLIGTRAQIASPSDGPVAFAVNGKDRQNYKGYFDLVVEVPDQE